MRIVLNVAMSLDAKVAAPDGGPLRLSGDEDFARVHRLRHASDAILVGSQTVLRDDPALLVKQDYVPTPRHPMRVILDGRARVPPEARVFDGRAPTLVFVREDAPPRAWPHADVARAPPGLDGHGVDVRFVAKSLADRGVRQLMVEGGPRTLDAFLQAGLADAFTVYVAPLVVGGGAPTVLARPGALAPLRLASAAPLGEGVLITYER